MVNVKDLGWDPKTVGIIDHRKVTAPYVRMESYKTGEHGDDVFFFDLRISQPNTSYLSTKELHSMEHLLLAGFRKYLPNNFICVAPMGCQTGFYLVLVNEGRADVVLGTYERILKDILVETEVPYANIQDCGHFEHHDLKMAQNIANKLLETKPTWRQVL